MDSAIFQVTESGRLCVFYYVNGTAANGRRLSENRVLEIFPNGTSSASLPVPLQQPFVNYFSASVRNGSPRSNAIDLLGQQAGRSNTISYARLRLW